ncbi:MAG: MFS transporter [Anaerolineae bacterium]
MRIIASQERAYWTAWVATLAFFVGYYTLLVPVPLYLHQIGLPDWLIGVILGAFGVASLIGRPLAGTTADTYGRRKVILFGTFSLMVGAIGFSFTTSPALLFGLRLLQAGGYVAFTTASTALVTDLVPAARRASAVAIFGIAANVAMTMTPAIISALMPVISLTGALWLSGAFAALGGLLAFGVPDTRPAQPRRGDWREVVHVEPSLRLPMLITCIFGLSWGAFLQFLPLLAERRDLGSAGLVYTVYGISIILSRLTVGRRLDTIDRSRVLVLSTLMMVAGLGLFAIATRQIELFAAAALVAYGSGIVHPALIAIHVERAAPEMRGHAIAIFYLGFDLGIGVGAWVLGLVLQGYGFVGLYGVAALAGLVVAAMLPRITARPTPLEQTMEPLG